VNGASRLQPVVLGIGQAAGVLAVVALEQNKPLAEVSIRRVQQLLLEQDAYIMPFVDINPAEQYFLSMQKAGAAGIFKGEGVPYLWANQTWFYPQRLVSEFEVVDGLRSMYPELKEFWGASGEYLTGARLLVFLKIIQPVLTFKNIGMAWKNAGLEGDFSPQKKLNRKEVSVLLDEILNFFEREVDWKGEFFN
jgi:hypothetical protein